jgi:uncharacterized protein YjbI with pentapeptide repeats
VLPLPGACLLTLALVGTPADASGSHHAWTAATGAGHHKVRGHHNARKHHKGRGHHKVPTTGTHPGAPAMVNRVLPAMTLTAAPAAVRPGQAPVLTVNMPLDATGSIGFYDAAQPGSDKGIGVAPINHGIARLTAPSRPLVLGNNPISASYGGDATYLANDSNKVNVTVGVQCLHQANAPAPPAGGAVFAGPQDTTDASSINVVVIYPGASWTQSTCGSASAASAAEMMSHPKTITVGAGGALLLRDKTHDLVSAWGARNVDAGDAAPVLFPGRPDWTTSEADTVDQTYLLNVWNSCRDCHLHGVDFDPVQVTDRTRIAYSGDLSGANLSGGTLQGNFQRWVFTGTDLSDALVASASLANASLDHTIVSGTRFSDVDLRGAQLHALGSTRAPFFAAARTGPSSGACTTFADSDLAGSILDITVDPGCEKSPLFPRSSIPTTEFYTLRVAEHAAVDWAGTQFVSRFDDRAELAGADLSGINLDDASFLGYPVDLSGAHFDGASLRRTNFELAELSGASFSNVKAGGASFHGADLAPRGSLQAADFSGTNTDLSQANFVAADISGAKFGSADLTGANFSRALAVGSDFTGVRAGNVNFSGAHIYGNGSAFDNASDLSGADFHDAVLAGAINQSGGFDLTNTDLSAAKFDGAQCISCNFTKSKLGQASFVAAYLPGATFASAVVTGAKFADAWLYCGDQDNSVCPTAGTGRWSWPLALGAAETYGPVAFAATNLTGVSFADVGTCPGGKSGSTSPAGCSGQQLLPDPDHTPIIPAGCSAAGPDTCPAGTSTLFDAGNVGSPLSIAAATPRTWATALSAPGYYVGFDDGTIRLIGNGSPRIVAGSPGKHCQNATAACGDAGPATQALLGTPAGLAVGLDGSLYIADSALHRVRRIDSSGQISTVAGDGEACTDASASCDGHGLALKAALAGPYGLAVTPDGQLYLADGRRGIRRVDPPGITTVATGGYDVRSVAEDFAGNIYAATTDPDYLVKTRIGGQLTKVVGTGASGYNGNTNAFGTLLPGTQVQINHPAGLVVARNGNVVFADTGNSLIRAYVPSSGHVADPLAGLVSGDTPQAGFNGDGRSGDQTKLDHPQAVAVIGDGLYAIADSGNRRVREIAPNPPPTGLLGARRAPLTCTVSLSRRTARPKHRSPKHPMRCTTNYVRGGKRGIRGVLVLATISRRHRTYATGTELASSHRRLRLALSEWRALRPGRYTLTLRRPYRNHRGAAKRIRITLVG